MVARGTLNDGSAGFVHNNIFVAGNEVTCLMEPVIFVSCRFEIPDGC